MAKFDDAVNALLLSQPFFGHLLMKFTFKATDHVPVAAVDATTMYHNPKAFDLMDNDEAIFVVAHEVMHCVWGHFPRLKHYHELGIGPDGKAFDMARMNRAMDYPLNASLVASKIGKVVSDKVMHAMFGPGASSCLDPAKFPPTMTPEEAYCLLAEEGQGGGGGGSGKPGSGGAQPFDSHEESMGADPSQPTSPIDPTDVLAAANIARMCKGNLPVGVDRLIDSLRRPDTSPWAMLRQFIARAMSGHDTSTWRRLNRRLITRGIGVPGRVAHGVRHVAIIVDTSGSIDGPVLELFGGHMAAILQDARPEQVSVLWTDAAVHRIDTVRNIGELASLLSKPVPGGGGTDMCKGVRAAETLTPTPDAIVVLTDGYTPFCDSKVRTVWAITTAGIDSPHGETIHIV